MRIIKATSDIFDIQTTKMPKDSRELNHKKIENLALLLNKTSFHNRKDNKALFFLNDKDRKSSIKPDFNKVDFKRIENNMEEIKSALSLQGFEVKSICMSPEWRMIIGLGLESVYETSMTLHHVYGVPYIPGSAIKGVVRSYIISEIFDHKEKEAFNNKVFCDIFGCPEKDSFYKRAMRGRVVFFDAMPIEKPKLEIDIINPHFGDYYKEKGFRQPGDYLQPVPVPFLVVQDTIFKFMIGVEEKYNKECELGELNGKLSDLVWGWFKSALCEHGIGAKTAVGYGLMKEEESKFSVSNNVIEEKITQPFQDDKNIADSIIVELKDKNCKEERISEIANKEIDNVHESFRRGIAELIKERWIELGKWDSGSKAQQKRVKKIKSFLGE
jgi:CRISPR-associated protein Cmr6